MAQVQWLPRSVLPILSVILWAGATLAAYEFESGGTDLTIGGVVATAVQCGDETCRAALPMQPELNLRLDERHELFVKFGFAAGDGLNVDTRFNIAPWAADLEANVENVNGSGRGHLLNAWYKYTARLRHGSTLETSVGVIDATDYLDDNAFSNDEYTQFMNSALVNGPNVFLPSYDPGVALEWTDRRWSASSVYMRIAENDDGQAFQFVGLQVAYRAGTPLGEGNYRLLIDGTDDRFYDRGGTSLESRSAVLISCDQQLGKTVGAFVRFGRQSDAAAIDYGYLYSGGLDLRGRAWGREHDNVGLGYAYLSGGNGELLRSHVWECYYRFGLGPVFSVTADLQYMKDVRMAGESPAGFVFGVRVTADF